MVWSCISTGIPGRLRHYVSTGEHLQVVQVRRLLQHQVPTMKVTTRYGYNTATTSQHRWGGPMLNHGCLLNAKIRHHLQDYNKMKTFPGMYWLIKIFVFSMGTPKLCLLVDRWRNCNVDISCNVMGNYIRSECFFGKYGGLPLDGAHIPMIQRLASTHKED